MGDLNGKWIWDFSMHLGVTTSVQAEIQMVRFGLSKAWDMGYKNIILETDSLIVVNMLTTNMVCLHLLSTLIDDCKKLLRRPWRVIPQHIYHEGNIYTNFLANKKEINKKVFVLIYFLHPFCINFLSRMLGT